MLIQRSLLATAAAGLLMALSGCGSSDNSTAGSGTAALTARQGASDTFVSRVLALIGTSSDTAEPTDIQSITVTTPDNADPVPLS